MNMFNIGQVNCHPLPELLQVIGNIACTYAESNYPPDYSGNRALEEEVLNGFHIIAE